MFSLHKIVVNPVILKDPTVISLLLANCITIILAVIEDWDLATILFIYLVQSVIIGIFTVITLLSCDTSALALVLVSARVNQGNPPDDPRRLALIFQIFLAGFFCLHYGLFHWGYFSFIVEDGIFGPVDFQSSVIWVSVGIFFVNHCYSFLVHRREENAGGLFIVEEFIRPYARIIPMHLTILFGSVIVMILTFLNIQEIGVILVLFLVLKTYVDIRMHCTKHMMCGESDETGIYWRQNSDL